MDRNFTKFQREITRIRRNKDDYDEDRRLYSLKGILNKEKGKKHI